MYNYTIFCNKDCNNCSYIKKAFFIAKIKYNNINIQFLSQKEYKKFQLKDYYKNKYLGNFEDFINNL